VDQGYDPTTIHYGSKRKEDSTSLPATTEELCSFGYNHDISRSLLGCWRARKNASMSGSRVLSHNRTLGASGRKIGRHCQPQQRNFVVLVTIMTFTLVARVLKGARDRIYKWIKGVISPPDTMGASGRKIGRHCQPQQRNFVV
jgi:hypothetical protein